MDKNSIIAVIAILVILAARFGIMCLITLGICTIAGVQFSFVYALILWIICIGLYARIEKTKKGD